MDANTKAWGRTMKGKTLHLITDQAKKKLACNAPVDLLATMELETYDEAQKILTQWWAKVDGLKLCSRCSLIYARWAAESEPVAAEPEMPAEPASSTTPGLPTQDEELPEGAVLRLSPGKPGARVEGVLTAGNVDDVRRWMSASLGRPVVPYVTDVDDEGEVSVLALKIPGVPYRVAHLGDTIVRHPGGTFTVLDPRDAAELSELRAILQRLGGHRG